MTVQVSVVIATYRRPQLLERCLRSLVSQTLPPGDYEIIVVDDGPEYPATRELVEAWRQQTHQKAPRSLFAQPAGEFSHKPQRNIPQQIAAVRGESLPALRYIPANSTQGPAAARNIGWRAAAGKLIAFTDDDCLPQPGWLANGSAAFNPRGNGAGTNGSNPEISAVTGRVIVPLSDPPTDNELNAAGLERSDFITANCFYRRETLELLGGFDERFATAWREDSDLYFSLREQGCGFARAEDAVVIHPVRAETWGASLRQQRKSFYNALLYKKHPALYRRYIQPAPPWHYYGMAAGLSAAVAGAVLGSGITAAVGLAAWFVLYAAFCRRRLLNTSRSPAHVLEMVITSLAIPFLSIYWRLRGAVRWRVFFL